MGSRASLRRSLDSAGHTVFSAKTGLPLNSSPAPLRRGHAFHFDAALTKVGGSAGRRRETGRGYGGRVPKGRAAYVRVAGALNALRYGTVLDMRRG